MEPERQHRGVAAPCQVGRGCQRGGGDAEERHEGVLVVEVLVGGIRHDAAARERAQQPAHVLLADHVGERTTARAIQPALDAGIVVVARHDGQALAQRFAQQARAQFRVREVAAEQQYALTARARGTQVFQAFHLGQSLQPVRRGEPAAHELQQARHRRPQVGAQQPRLRRGVQFGEAQGDVGGRVATPLAQRRPQQPRRHRAQRQQHALRQGRDHAPQQVRGRDERAARHTPRLSRHRAPAGCRRTARPASASARPRTWSRTPGGC